MKNIIFCFLLFLFQYTWAWEFEFSGSERISPGLIIELDDGSVVVPFTIFNNGQYGHNSFLLHINSKGQLLDSIDYTNHFPGYKNTVSGLALIDGDIVFAAYLKDSSARVVAGMIKMDQNFNILKDTIYSTIELAGMEEIWGADHGYIVSGLKGHLNTNGYRTFWYLNKDLEILNEYVDSNHVVTPYFNHGWPAFDRKRNKIFLSIAYGELVVSNVTTPNNYTDFQVWDGFENDSKPFPTESGTILLPGHYLHSQFPVFENNLMIYSFDTNRVLIDSVIIPSNGIENRPASFYSITEIDGDIYFGVTTNMSLSQNLFSTSDTTAFRLIKYNSNLELQWIKTYKQDARYQMQNLMKTKDNGIIMWGERWDFNKYPNDDIASIYILKVDTSGISTGISNYLESRLNFQLYPNPAQSILNVEFSDLDLNEKVQISINDIQGKEVKSIKKLSMGLGSLKLDISNLEHGIYLVQVRSGQQSQSLPFVKIH